MTYIATFFSHFGAIRFNKELSAKGTAVTLMPVPRALSSSCGTCASFTADELPAYSHMDELEQIAVSNADHSYTVIYSSEE